MTAAPNSSFVSTASLLREERFDVAAFERLRSKVTVSLGSSTVPDAKRRRYAEILFRASLVHKPEASELSCAEHASLRDVCKIRLGHTNSPERLLRPDMAYVCLSELISLVSIHDRSVERVRLAQAVAPFLVRRVALPLKSYTTDRPLLGRMPLSSSKREELIFVLQALKKLHLKDKMTSDLIGCSPASSRHLCRLFPLFIQALKVASGDKEILQLLLDLLDVLGNEVNPEHEGCVS